MPTQALLKATLLKETYGPLVELNGPSKRNHAVASVFPSRLSGMERQFLDLIAPQLFPIRAVQDYRRSSRLERPVPRFQDFVEGYERLLAASSWIKRCTKVAPLDEDFEFSTTQLQCQKVSTPKRHSPNALSEDFDASPEETLKNCRNAILKTVMADLDDEEGSWPVSHLDAKEHSSGIEMPFASLTRRQRQVGVQLKKSGLSSGTASSSSPMSATVGGEKIGNPAERKMVHTVLTTLIQHTVEENGSGETPTFAMHLQQAHKGATEEVADEKPLPENSNARLSRSMSLNRSSMSFMELLFEGENLEDQRRKTLQTTKGNAQGKSIPNTLRSIGEFDHLAGQPLHSKRSHNFAVDALDQLFNNTAERCKLGGPIVDAKQALNSSERPDVSENPAAKSNGNNHRRQSSLERFSSFFGKSRSMKESTRFTDAKPDFSRGSPEVSHIIENFAAKSHSDSRHRPLEKLSTMLEKSRSLNDSAVFSTDFSKSGPSEVPNRNQINASTATSRSDTNSFRRCQSTKERACPAAGHNYLNFSSSTTTRTISSGSTSCWAPAMPTIACKTVQKLQGMLGRSTSFRAAHIRPVAERDEAKSTPQSQERNASSNLPHCITNESSLRQLRMDRNDVVGARCGTRSAEYSVQGEGQTISSLVADELKQESKLVKKTDSLGNFPLFSPLARRLKGILGRQWKVNDASGTKVGKASGWSTWSVSYTDGLSPPQKSSAKNGVSLKQASGKSPRSSSTRRMVSPRRMPHRGYPVSPRRMSPRGYPVSPKRNGGHGTKQTRQSVKPLKSDGFIKRRLPNRSDPAPTKVHLIGSTEELPSSGVSKTAATNAQMELTDMRYSGARNLTSMEQGRVEDRESERSNVWPHPIPGYSRRRPTSSSRFQREHIAIHTNSIAIACES